MPDRDTTYRLYQDLQQYVGWTEADGARVQGVAAGLARRIERWVSDFCRQIERHPATAPVMQGDPSQVERLQASLRGWLQELLQGPYDADYVWRRWQAGHRHAQLGLDPIYTNAALSRLRTGLLEGLLELPQLTADSRWATLQSLNRLLDLDLAIIEDAYESHRLRLATQVERRRSDSKFRNLVEAAASMIVILRPDRSIAYFSPYAEELTGYRSTELVGQVDFATLVSPESQPGVRDCLNQVLDGKPVKDFEIPVRCHDGSRRWLLWNLLRMEDFEGQPALLAVGHDVTEKRRTDERLLQAERLAAIGQTITGLAHESRNALQRINSCLEMLEFEVEQNEEALRLIHRTQQAQDDLRRLFDEVRGFAAPISLEPSMVDLDGVWREAWSLLQTERDQRDVQLEESIDVSSLRMSVDRFRMVQVFRNLLENSLAACRDPVRVFIVCRAARLSRQECLEVRVRDNGPGLSELVRRRVFQPFFTTKTKGTGLGMAIAHRIVEAHGGTLEVGEDWDQGAEFVVRLPREMP